LRSRLTDDDSVIAKRISNAKQEVYAVGEYDFFIVNDDIEQATSEFIIVANAARLKRSAIEEEQFVKNWLG
jgi:guanylate kinase